MNGFWPDALIARKEQAVAHTAELRYWYRYTLSRLAVFFESSLLKLWRVRTRSEDYILLCCAT